MLKLQLDLARASGSKKTKQMSQQSVNDPTYPFQLFPHILGMTRGQHTKHHGHRWVIGEEIESRGVEIWDIEEKVAEVEHSKEGDVLCVAAVKQWKADCPSQQRGCQFTGPPAGGWGPLIGGPGGRGRGPHASQYPGQQHPSPANLQAPMHPTWGPEGTRGTVEGAHRGPP